MSCIVADSGPLIALAGVELLHLPAAVFGTAFITETVLGECEAKSWRPDAQANGYFLGDSLIRRVEQMAGE